MDVITFPENLKTTSGLAISLHGFILLHDATSYDKFLFQITRPGFILGDELLGEPGLINEVESLIIDTLILLGADRDTAEADGKALLEFELNLQLVS